MAATWGDFASMAVHYLRELAKRGEQRPMLICKELEPVYCVCTYAEYAEMITLSGRGMYRPVSAASPDEFMGILFARFGDFIEEEEEDATEESVQTGQQPGDKHSTMATGGDSGKAQGHGNDGGDQGTIH